ncbi:thiolase family protein [soil metagenome]
MPEAVIVDIVRTPSGRGKVGGQLSHYHPVDLFSDVLEALVTRNQLDPALVDDVIGGCVSQVGNQAFNVTRSALLAAGFPEHVPGTTIDRQCGSSQQAVHFAAQGVLAGAYDVVIAGGVELMSRVPMGSSAAGEDTQGSKLRARYDPGLVGQGISAELISAKWGFGREDLDEFSAESHRRAAQATANGDFTKEVLSLSRLGPDGVGPTITSDETIRASTTQATLAGLDSSFYSEEYAERFPQINWNITPGNSSPLTDGASAALIMSAEMANKLGLKPRAVFRQFEVIGSDPIYMLTAPIPATRRILEKAHLTIEDLDAYEVNEAFAPVPLAWAKELHADPAKLNPRGGAIALGHALGSSGTRLLATLVNHLEDTGGRYGLQTMCEGAGMANAMIIERV